MKKVLIVLAEIFAVLLLAMPERAMASAAAAMAVWFTFVAPALFPFLAILPLLTCPEACRAYDRLLGWLARPLLGLPGEMTSAVVIAMAAGSPAGAMAAVRIAASRGIEEKYLKRCALAFGGLGPVFLVSGVGVAMFGDRRIGLVLLAGQIAAQLAMAAVLRLCFRCDTRPVAPIPEADADAPVRSAALSALQVCGWMTLFSVIAGMLVPLLGVSAARWALCALDFPGGAAMMAGTAWPLRWRVTAVGGMLGFGGVCVACQNMAALRRAGVGWGQYLAARVASGAICAAAAWALCPDAADRAMRVSADMSRAAYAFSARAAMLAAAPCAAALFHHMLTKQKRAKQPQKS